MLSCMSIDLFAKPSPITDQESFLTEVTLIRQALERVVLHLTGRPPVEWPKDLEEAQGEDTDLVEKSQVAAPAVPDDLEFFVQVERARVQLWGLLGREPTEGELLRKAMELRGEGGQTEEEVEGR